MTDRIDIVALDAQNSLDFLDHALALYAEGTPFAICRKEIRLEDYPALNVTRRITPGTRHGWAAPAGLHMPVDDSLPDGGTAHLVFSSGTESTPKAILIGRRALADVEDRLLSIMGITSEIREYIGVPVTYSFGLGRARVVARAGGRFYLPAAFDPGEIRRMLAAGEINAISAVPSLWRILLAQPGFLGELGARVRWIEIGSQYMSAAEKAALRDMFPNARIVQHYGLTEASRSTFLAIDEVVDEALESVGTGIGETGIRIGDEGEVCIRGPHVASGLVGTDGRITPLTDADGWLHTRDRGRIEHGLLFYGGRLDDQINLSGVKLASEALEHEVAALVSAEPGHFAITSVPDPLRGDAILLAHDAEAAPSAGLLSAALEQVLTARGIGSPGTAYRVMAVEDLPRTGSGKIRRAALREDWAERPAATTPPVPGGDGPESDAPLSPGAERIAETWREVLGPVPLGPESGFYDVGGDSLGAMQIGLAMETRFPRDVVKATLEGRPLAEIARLLDSDEAAHTGPAALPARTVDSWSINILRGIMVISILMSHWMPGVWARIAPGMDQDPLAVISRMGTPGFAIVFGVTAAYFMLAGHPGNRASVRRRLRVSLTLVGAAMVLLAATRIGTLLLEGRTLDLRDVAEAFYNVLAFYLLALLSLPLWLRLLKGRETLGLALGIPLMWLAWRVLQAEIGGLPQDGLLEWPRLMLVAKYAYFHMFPMVLTGVGIGLWMMHATDPRVFAGQAIRGGTLLTAAAVILVMERNGLGVLVNRDAGFWTAMSGTMLYAGLVTLLLGLVVRALRRWHEMPSLPRTALRLLILLGGLALPVYAFHELVIPFKDLLAALGLPGAVSIATSMGLFFAALGYGMWRIDRMYFG